MNRPLTPKEIAAELGYTYNSVKAMRSAKSPMLEGLKTFKLCGCEKRLTEAGCNHRFYAWREDIEAFLRQRAEAFTSRQHAA